jgi:hypothetical protein
MNDQSPSERSACAKASIPRPNVHTNTQTGPTSGALKSIATCRSASDPFRTSRLTGRAIRIGIFGYPLADVPFASTSILRPNALFGPHTIRHGGSGENSSPK